MHNTSLKNLNTFGLDVTCSHFYNINDISELQKLIKNKLINPIFVLGGGSNILFTKPYTGTILKNNISQFEVLNENDNEVTIRVGGGNNWHETVLQCVANNWGGLENLSLIPGSVGAAPIQNIGAYGSEIQSVLKEVHYVDLLTGNTKTINKMDCNFGYRDSIFKNELKNIAFIYAVDFVLTKNTVLKTEYGDIQRELEANGILNPSIKDVSNAVIKIRESKLPNPAVLGNCGSFFKNPIITNEQFNNLKHTFTDIKGFAVGANNTKVPAGWLIEKCGFKGVKYGQTGMHALQALVLINYGNATGIELLQMAVLVQSTVLKTFGILLDIEVNVW